MKEKVRNSNLDIIRVVAAFMVVMVHVGDQFPNVRQITGVGTNGVECFFVLSGYLILQSLEKCKSYKEFYIKRLTKIAPGYYATLLIIYIVDAVRYLFVEGMSYNQLFFNDGPNSIHFLGGHLAFLQMFIPSNHFEWFNNRYGLWTMSSFVFFYIVIPPIYNGISKLKNKFTFSFCILVILLILRPICIDAFMQFPITAGVFAARTPVNTLYCFWFGVTLYWAVKENKQNVYCVLCGLFMVLSQFKLYSYPIIFLLLINMCINSPEFIKNDRARKTLSFLSQGSFYLYLCHPIVLAIVNWVCNWIGITGIFKAVLICICAVGISYAIYYIAIIPLDRKLKEICINKNIDC